MRGRRNRQDSEEPGPSTAPRRRRQSSSEPGPSTSRQRRPPAPSGRSQRRRSPSGSASPVPCSSTDVSPKKTGRAAAPSKSKALKPIPVTPVKEDKKPAKPKNAGKAETKPKEKHAKSAKDNVVTGDKKKKNHKATTGKSKSEKKQRQAKVPVYFQEPKMPPMVLHLQEIPLVDSVDEMHQHYQFNAEAKMEFHVEAIKGDIEDLDYLVQRRESEAKEMDLVYKHLRKLFKAVINRPIMRIKNVNLRPKELIYRFDTLDTDVYYDDDKCLETVINGVIAVREPALKLWRQNTVFTSMVVSMINGLLKFMVKSDSPDLDRYNISNRLMKTLKRENLSDATVHNMDQAFVTLRITEGGLDSILKTLLEFVVRMVEQEEELPERFMRRYFDCKNATTADVVKNEQRRAEADLPHFVGLVNMQIDENLQATDAVYSEGVNLMPAYDAWLKREQFKKANEGKMVKVPATFFADCRKQIAKSKEFIAKADKELQECLEKTATFSEQKLRLRFIDKYNDMMALGREQDAFRRHVKFLQKLRQQRHFKYGSLKALRQKAEDNLVDIMKMRVSYSERIIMMHQIEGVKRREVLQKEWEELQLERSKIHRQLVIRTATAKHQYPMAQKQLAEHVAVVKENIVCVTNPKINYIEAKKAILEKARRDEQEAKYYNRHSFVVPCPLPNRLRPPFSNLEHERQQVRQIRAMASQSAPTVSSTLQALSDPSQYVRRDALKRAAANDTPTTTRRTSPKFNLAKRDARKSPPLKSSTEQKAVVEKPPSAAKASVSTPNVPTSSHRDERRRSRSPPRHHEPEKERDAEKTESRFRSSVSYSERDRQVDKSSGDRTRNRDTRREPERHRVEGSRSFQDDQRDRDDRDQRQKADPIKSARTDESRATRTDSSRSRDDTRSRDESRSTRDDYSRNSRHQTSTRTGRDESASRSVRDDRGRSQRDDDKRDRRFRNPSPVDRSRKRPFESPERSSKRTGGGSRYDERKDRDDRDRRDKDDRDRSRDYRPSRSSASEIEPKRPRREDDQQSRSDSRTPYRTPVKPSKETSKKDSKASEKISRSSSSAQKVDDTSSRKHGEATPRKPDETTPRKLTESATRRPAETTSRKYEDSTPRKPGESSRSKDTKKSSSVSEAAPIPKKPKVEEVVADEKAAISTNEIDDLLEETFEPPKPKERKHLTLEEINQLVRDNRVVELGKMTPEQRDKFVRSVLPSQDRRPIYYPEVIGHPSNMDAYMKSRGFDIDNDPPDAPWRKAMEVLTMKHFLKHVNQALQRQLRNFAQTDLMNPLVYPIEIPRQIHINNKLAKTAADDAEKKKKLNINLIKAKTATASGCFKALGDMKDTLHELHEAEDMDLTNFTEKARVQNELRYVEERVTALKKWNESLRDGNSAYAVGNVKKEKFDATVDKLNNLTEKETSTTTTKLETLNELIAEKRKQIAERKAQLAAAAKQKEALMEKMVDTDKKLRESELKYAIAKRDLKETRAIVAEIEEETKPDVETQQIYNYYASILICKMCKVNPVDAGFKKCLHLYCRDCLLKFLEKPGAKKCPVCKIKVTMKDFTRMFL